MEEFQTHCYCGTVNLTHPEGTFQCSKCKRRFHPECLKNPVVSPLAADTFYNFTCSQCAPDGGELYSRAKMSWLDALLLTLYNLQLGGGGKRGYFRWKDHICAFINKHWSLLFGHHRKKKASWHGTVAGTVSSGCPRHFISGTLELGEPGWWKLAMMKPPLYSVDPPAKAQRRPKQTALEDLHMEVTEEEGVKRSRRCRNFSLSAASELKAKRSTINDHPKKKRRTMAAMAETLAQATAWQQDVNRETDHDSLHTEHSHPLFPAGLDLKSDFASDGSVPQDLKSDLTSSVWNPQETLISSPFQPIPVETVNQMAEVSTAHLTSSMAQALPPQSQINLPQEPGLSVRSEVSTSHSGESDFAGKEEEDSLSCTDDPDFSAEGSLQVPSADSLLLNPADSDDDCSDMYSSMSPVTMGMTFEPCQSPDMVDLVMSMPASGEGESLYPASHSPQTVPEQPAPHALSLENTQPPTQSGKHPPHKPTSAEDSAIDSEGPSEGEEELRERSEGEEDEEEEEEEGGRGEERREDRDSTMTVLSVPSRVQRRVKRKARQGEVRKELEPEEDTSHNLRLMTPYDETVMLEKLEGVMSTQPRSKVSQPLEPWEARRLCQQRNILRRKLIVRKLQRENGLPVFDIEAVMGRLAEKYYGIKSESKEMSRAEASASTHPHSFSSRTLDRFMRQGGRASVEVQHTSFHTRLVGFEDHQMAHIVSPFTMRVLKPFIWRDMETVPLKVKLMQEIIRYPHRNDPTSTPPTPASLDYCYVRPQHIPSVNALCCAYFWPGIDLSECLQYPDFSCVVMYRKLVVGFAFLVPDVKHNEAYISFIFTRPEWRGAGIASFMLYHLCQTCMGKDITLHVSATNPAMLLYHKFGFKAEELCLNFYDKYFPVDSKDCKHAFFMRLR